MSDPKYHDRHTAGIYRAIALRFYCRYVDMRDSAENCGGDLTDHGKLPTARDVTDQYTAAIEEWLWEAPASATAALALVEFAGVITADRLLGEVLRDQILAEERDAFLSVGCPFHCGAMAQQAGAERACRALAGRARRGAII